MSLFTLCLIFSLITQLVDADTMKMTVLAVGERMPAWVDAAFAEYAKRLPHECRLELKPISAGRRGRGADTARICRQEGDKIMAAAGRGIRLVALERRGRSLSTEQLADQLNQWMASGDDVAFAIGGPEGLSEPCLAAASLQWSLSPLTMAHPVARVVLAEQLYRAWSLVRGHPYHRGE